jgi:hypothetical protein
MTDTHETTSGWGLMNPPLHSNSMPSIMARKPIEYSLDCVSLKFIPSSTPDIIQCPRVIFSRKGVQRVAESWI